MSQDRSNAAIRELGEALGKPRRDAEVAQFNQQIVGFANGVGTGLFEDALKVLERKMEIAPQGQLQPGTGLLLQLGQKPGEVCPIIGIAIIGVGRGNRMGYTIRHGHAAHFNRRIPRFGAVVNLRQKMAVDINHGVIIRTHPPATVLRSEIDASKSLGCVGGGASPRHRTGRGQSPQSFEVTPIAVRLRWYRLLVHDSRHDLFILTQVTEEQVRKMSFLRAARAALAGQVCLSRILAAVVAIMAALSLSCGGSYSRSAPNHNAYVTVPANGYVLLLHIDGATGAITLGTHTVATVNTSPNGLALLPSKKFLYVANSADNSISIFNVGSDGTLTLSGTPTPAGSSPFGVVIDPSGKYLLVTNSLSNDVSVFSIDSGSGALTAVAGSPFPANTNPTEILITPSGNAVYVANPGIGTVTAYSFSSSTGALTQVPGSPFISGAGASGLAVDGSGRFLYVANPSALNPLVSTIGNISGFNIDAVSGTLTPILGSPFTSTVGMSPSAITVDPSGRFVYAVTPGSSFSIWCFAITSTNGQLTAVLNSPFSQPAGELFAITDPAGGYFYIGSQLAHTIAGYTLDPSTGVPKVIAGSPFTTDSAPGKMVLSE
jgi:6-phosphogluconolactonase